ncbi:MAG TPA: VCBS repeat-containing protein [Planctomycetota bacterium]|jgi:hypothetical protein|nr:VCBS repeat-containing protein [Planctomycetota bacterium]
MLTRSRLAADGHRRGAIHDLLGGIVTFAFAALALAWIAGLERGPAAPEREPAGDAASTFSAVEVTALHEDLDPARDGWESEVFSERAGARLGELALVLAAPGLAKPESLEPFLDLAFRCSDLRPDLLKEIYSEGGVHVTRGIIPGGEAMILLHEGPSGLATALEDLSSPWPQLAAARVKLKIIAVNRGDGDEWWTTVALRASAADGQTSVQQNGRWFCRWGVRAGGEPFLRSVQVTAFGEVRRTTSGEPWFADCTEAVLGGNSSYRDQLLPGIRSWSERLDRATGISFLGFEGVAVGDVDGDGLEDLYVCQVGGLPNKLFIQQPDGTATDESARSGADYIDLTHSALLCDLDGDGDQDLVVATHPITIHSNDGNGRFTLETTFDATIVYAMAAADPDGDGDLDLYLCRYSEARDTAPLPYHDANNGPTNLYLRNDGGFEFTDATESVGLDHNNQRFSFAAAWVDYDADGDVDLYVANDYGRNNLYRNDGGRFTDVAGAAGVEDLSAGMSVAWSDMDMDGDLDLYVGNMFSSAGNRIAYQRRFKQSADAITRSEFQRHARGNSLFANRGDGTFEDVSEESGVTMALWSWASKFVDINNDGLEDIYVANGMVTNEDPGDL